MLDLSMVQDVVNLYLPYFLMLISLLVGLGVVGWLVGQAIRVLKG